MLKKKKNSDTFISNGLNTSSPVVYTLFNKINIIRKEEKTLDRLNDGWYNNKKKEKKKE